MLVQLMVLLCATVSAKLFYYDAYSGCKLSDKEWEEYVERNITFWCTNQIDLPCDSNAYRTLNGSCNNLLYPMRGAPHTPMARILNAEFGTGNRIRPTKSGKPPRPPRQLRVAALTGGNVPSPVFSHLATHNYLFYTDDIQSLHDTVSTIITNCCGAEEKHNPRCAPLSVSDNDPVHHFSNIRCMNNTIPITYQNIGCRVTDSTPSRMTTITPFLDLESLYGFGNDHKYKSRLYKDGLLKYEVVNGRIWPLPIESPQKAAAVCVLNKMPQETRCHDAPTFVANGLLGTSLLVLWSLRLHNFIATELKKVNPCWSDEKLFQASRDITISLYTQWTYYEFMPALFGWENLVRDGILLSNMYEFRDIYDEKEVPQIFLETTFIMRYIHTLQPGFTELYDCQGHYLDKISEVGLSFRTGYLALGNNLDYVTQGAFRQPAAHVDNIVDPMMSEVGFPFIQRAFDILSGDLNKNRLYGLPSYVKYLDFCNGGSHKTFDDLAPYFAPDRLEIIKNNYEHVEDVDLLFGIWLEKPMAGGHLPSTFYCIMSRQLLKHIQYDRHWYERPNRPHANTKAQLLEIRKSTIALLLCTVGDKVTEIQRHAFFKISPTNPTISCDDIPRVNFEAWADPSCHGCKK